MKYGVAYRTQIPAVSESPGAAAIYAVHPPADFRGGTEETTLVLVESIPEVDTCVYPCNRAGALITVELLGHVPRQSHRQALLAAGYELEVPHGR